MEWLRSVPRIVGIPWVFHRDGKRRLTIRYAWKAAKGKSGRVRHVPLTEMAMEWLRSVPRIVGIPWVFHRDGKRRLTIRYAWKAAKDEAKVEYRFHDLRHYRASSWVRLGVDLRTVQELLGHADIHTTMRYSHFSPSHAVRAVREAERLERKLEETNSDRDNSVKQETG